MIYKYPTSVVEAAQLLDNIKPNWFKSVTKPLSMYNYDKCVLGQVYGNYLDAMQCLFGFNREQVKAMELDDDSIFGANADSVIWYAIVTYRINTKADTEPAKWVSISRKVTLNYRGAKVDINLEDVPSLIKELEDALQS